MINDKWMGPLHAFLLKTKNPRDDNIVSISGCEAIAETITLPMKFFGLRSHHVDLCCGIGV